VFWVFAAGLAAMAGYLVLDASGLADAYDGLASFLLGLASGVLVLGWVYTSRRRAAPRRAQQRRLEALRREEHGAKRPCAAEAAPGRLFVENRFTCPPRWRSGRCAPCARRGSARRARRRWPSSVRAACGARCSAPSPAPT